MHAIRRCTDLIPPSWFSEYAYISSMLIYELGPLKFCGGGIRRDFSYTFGIDRIVAMVRGVLPFPKIEQSRKKNY